MENTGTRVLGFGRRMGYGQTANDRLYIGDSATDSQADDRFVTIWGDLSGRHVHFGKDAQSAATPELRHSGFPTGAALQESRARHVATGEYRWYSETGVTKYSHKVASDSGTGGWKLLNSADAVCAHADARGYFGVSKDEPEHPLDVYEDGNRRGAVTAGGYVYAQNRVGVGTIAPDHPLDVYSGAVRQGSITADGYGYFRQRLGVAKIDPDDPLEVWATTKRFNVTAGGVARFNDAFSFPSVDGAANNLLKTDGAGAVTWSALAALIQTLTDYNASNRQILVNDQSAIKFVDAATQTVVTAMRVSGNDLQYKTRSIYVWPAAAETDWVTWHAGTACP